MKYRHPYVSGGRTVSQITLDWFDQIGLDRNCETNKEVHFSWCGQDAVTVSQTEYKACRIILQNWVVRELIECDCCSQIGEITIVRDRAGLRELTHKLIKVFDHRTKDLRRKTMELEEKFDRISKEINSKIESGILSYSEKKQFILVKKGIKCKYIEEFDQLCKEYKQIPDLKGYLPD